MITRKRIIIAVGLLFLISGIAMPEYNKSTERVCVDDTMDFEGDNVPPGCYDYQEVTTRSKNDAKMPLMITGGGILIVGIVSPFRGRAD